MEQGRGGESWMLLGRSRSQHQLLPFISRSLIRDLASEVNTTCILFTSFHPSCKANFEEKAGVAFSVVNCPVSSAGGAGEILFASFQLLLTPAPKKAKLMFADGLEWPKENSMKYSQGSNGGGHESLSQ